MTHAQQEAVKQRTTAKHSQEWSAMPGGGQGLGHTYVYCRWAKQAKQCSVVLAQRSVQTSGGGKNKQENSGLGRYGAEAQKGGGATKFQSIAGRASRGRLRGGPQASQLPRAWRGRKTSLPRSNPKPARARNAAARKEFYT